jgi:hypothetical protein
MRLIKIIASAGIVLVLASVKTQAEPASAPGPTAASNTPAAPPAIKPVKKRFLLSRGSANDRYPADEAMIDILRRMEQQHLSIIDEFETIRSDGDGNSAPT